MHYFVFLSGVIRGRSPSGKLQKRAFLPAPQFGFGCSFFLRPVILILFSRAVQKGEDGIEQWKLLASGSVFLRTDGLWCGVVWCANVRGERKCKSFSGNTKADVNKKMIHYVIAFDRILIEYNELKRTLKESRGASCRCLSSRLSSVAASRSI